MASANLVKFLPDTPSPHPATEAAPGTLISPTLPSIGSWLSYFGLGANTDAIQYLMEEAKEEPGYNDAWLKTVKDTIGEKAYNHWLDNVLINVTNNKPTFRAFDSQNNSTSFRSSLTKKIKNSSNIANPEEAPPSAACASQSKNFSSEEGQNVVLSNLWHKLKEEHLMYLTIINKTDELLSTVKQLKPVSSFENILKSMQESSQARRTLNAQEVVSNAKNISTNQFVNGKLMNLSASDYSDNDTDFFIVDYEESAEIDVNQSVPRLIIRVENNMDRPIKIGNINLKYEDDNLENVTQSVYDQNDYYVDEFQYFKTPNNSAITDKYQ